MNETNVKSAAWDLMGERFWTEIDEGGRPSKKEIDLYLDGVNEGHAVCVVGASMYFLIKQVVELDASVTVVDFSPKMCADLERSLEGRAKVVCHDILFPAPSALQGRFDYVISDRIVNRFTHDELSRAAKTFFSFLASDGVLRLGVKLGLEGIDKQLMDAAKKHNVQIDGFWNESTATIDYSAARELLEKVEFDYGDVPRDIILKWFDQRGRESRYTEEEVIAGLKADGREFRTTNVVDFPDTPATKVFIFQRG